MNKKLKIILTVTIVILFSVGSCLLINALGLDDISKIKNVINDGWIGSLVYVILLAIQIMLVPINSIILIVPAMVIFGPLKAYLLSLVGLVIGSLFAFYMGRIFGLQFIAWLVGKEKAELWKKKLGDNGKLMLPIFFLIPIFPDELICMLAGLSNIKITYFLCVVIITRAIDLAFTCFIGSIIPFHGWWLALWAVVLILTFIGSYYLAKYQNSIQTWIENKFNKNKSSK